MSAETGAPAILLAVETSVDICGVALFKNSQLASERTFRHDMHLSERLIGHIDGLLLDCGVTLQDIGVFAVGIGPGSFTGTRIGVMTVKTLASILNTRVIGIASLDAIAADFAGLHGSLVAPMLPCRRDVVFACLYDCGGGEAHRLVEPEAYPIAELVKAIVERSPRSVVLTGSSAPVHLDRLTEELGAFNIEVSHVARAFPRAAQVAQLALDRITSGEPLDEALELVPLYISPPPITMPKSPIPVSLPEPSS